MVLLLQIYFVASRAKMHRAYQPTTPANNKLLKKRWDENLFDTHRRKVTEATPLIDNKPPKAFMHLLLPLKKLQYEEERIASVERDNRILLEKISYIMRTKARLDNWKSYDQKSLNKAKRQRELLRITHENQAILKRISSKEPHYNHYVWEDEWRVKQGYMANIARYPQEWGYLDHALRYSSRRPSYHPPKYTRRKSLPKLKTDGQQ